MKFGIINIRECMEKMLDKLNNEGKINVKGVFESAYVIADKDLVDSIMKNLIENARKAEPVDNLILVKRRNNR